MEHMSRRVGHARTGREGVSCKIVWQMAVAISCETTKKLQFRLSMPRSPALQPLVRGDRSWLTTLPANTVSELMMVPIGRS